MPIMDGFEACQHIVEHYSRIGYAFKKYNGTPKSGPIALPSLDRKISKLLV